MKTVGILGGGQLGCMLGEALQNLGAKVIFYDQVLEVPGKKRTDSFYFNSWSDLESLTEFFSACDVVTFEFENVDARFLADISQATHVPIYPHPSVLTTTQSRELEKTFLLDHHLPCAPYAIVHQREDLEVLKTKDIFPAIAKTLRGGYDGKGQVRLQNSKDLEQLIDILPCVIEERLELYAEASCIVGRNLLGETISLPIGENKHSRQILDYTIMPPPSLPKAIQNQIRELAISCAESLGVIGLLTTEFFVCKQAAKKQLPLGNLAQCGEWYLGINEFAPRPHNSGHISREALSASQYEVLARILLNLPLPQIQLRGQKYFAMGNLLGDLWLDQAKNTLGYQTQKNCEVDAELINLLPWQAFPAIEKISLYGKSTAKAGRKMGHFTLSGDKPSELIRLINDFRKALIKVPLSRAQKK